MFLFIVDDLCDRESRRRKEELQQAVEKSSNNACTVYKGNRCPYIFSTSVCTCDLISPHYFFSFSKQKREKSLVQMKSQVVKTESVDIFLINWVCI